jgi:hypothetical protein
VRVKLYINRRFAPYFFVAFVLFLGRMNREIWCNDKPPSIPVANLPSLSYMSLSTATALCKAPNLRVLHVSPSHKESRPTILQVPQFAPDAKASQQVFALIVLDELHSREGAAVSVNVRAKDACESELGEIIKVVHEPVVKTERVTSKTDRDVVTLLLSLVQQQEPRADMTWDDDARSWFIFVPRIKE